jgi:hypothetical protein
MSSLDSMTGDFVISAMKEHIHRHGDRHRSRSKDVTAEEVVNAVFKSLSMDPATARTRTKISAVARGRALSAWLWVERLGHPQIDLADAMNVSPEAVTMMLSRLRREGLKRGEKQHLNRILKTLTEKKGPGKTAGTQPEEPEPRVIIMKRQRR